MRTALSVLAVVGALAVAGCSSAADPGPRFDDGGNKDVACMQHQPQPPGTRYTDAGQRQTGDTLPLLRYYTANGGKPYCDRQQPSDADKAWAGVYVQLGADRGNVHLILDAH